ncbi:hypothetical protein ACVII0_002935 [Sinorhizobium meliloti]
MTAAAQSEDTWAVGERVHHRKYGAGLIEDIEENRVTVKFDNGSTKRILAGYLEAGVPKAANDNVPAAANDNTIGVINPADWHGEPIPARQWFVDGLIPARQVTILNGDGGVGKSF